MSKAVMNDKKRKRPAPRRLLLFLELLLLAILAAAAVRFAIDSLAYQVFRAEAGMEIRASDMIRRGDPEAVFAPGSAPFDPAIPGSYHVRVRSGLFTHSVTLVIQDTVPPALVTRPVTLMPGETCAPEDFVQTLSDATALSVRFLLAPDYSRMGSQTVSISVTDLGGNTVVRREELLISRLVRRYTLEAGSPVPSPEDFLAAPGRVEPVTDFAALSTDHVGDFPVVLLVDGVEYESALHVVDTVPPQVQLQNLTSYLNAERKASDFVASAEDNTSLTAAFTAPPDLTLQGTQQLEINLTDEGGNRFTGRVLLTLNEDTEAPVIGGALNLTVLEGENLSYRKGLRVTDNCMQGLALEIDSSAVNLDKEGVYKAAVTATDLAGNSASAEVTVTVLPWAHPKEELDALADRVISQICTEDMTLWEKAEAIYSYVRGNVTYQSSRYISGNWSQAAYQGLTERRGECYVMACTARVLLERVGAECMDISRANHRWLLVNVGDGWYHMDCTPMPDDPWICLWTSARLEAYSRAHNGTHTYDPSLYPEIR